jgi:tyrosine-protein kinase Etk/Wzc
MDSSQTPHQSMQDEDEISLLDLAETIAERLWLLVFGPLFVGLIALGVSFLIPPTFTARTVLMPPQAQQSAAASLLQSLGALGGVAGAAVGIKNPNDQIVALLKSRTLSDRMIERFDLMKVYNAKLRQDARKALEGSVRFSSGKDGLIVVEVDDKDPVRAADMANAYIEELARLMGSLAVTEAQQRRVFFERQLKEARDNLTQAEIALKSGGIEADIFKSSPAAAVTAVAQVQAQIAAQEVRLGSMRGYMTESAPEFRQGLVELQALRAQLAKLEATDRTQPGEAGGDYITRFREYKYFETLFELFAKQYEIARVDESRDGAVIQIVDPALVPEWKTKPKRALIAVIATLAAGFGLLLLVFVRKALSNASKDAETAAKLERIRLAIGFPTRQA